MPSGLIFVLDQPEVLLGSALGLVTGTVLPSVAQAYLAASWGDQAARRFERRTSLDPRRHIDVFSVIAMVLSGLGWAKRVPLDQRRLGGRGRFLAVLALGPVVNLALGAATLAVLYHVASAGRPAVALAAFGVTQIYLGVLRCVPLPPLDGARAMWALAPRSPGWQRAQLLLEEQQYGLIIVLALSLPLFSQEGLLVRVVSAVADPVLRLLARLLGA